MRITFQKMHGAGNDFIMIDGRQLMGAGTALERPAIAALCNRRLSIGADGLILILPHGDQDFEMVYFNSDGGEAEMCGNGARCAFHFGRELGLIGESGTFMTNAGVVRATLDAGEVRVSLPAVRDLRLNLDLGDDFPQPNAHFVNTGVPHLVLPVENLESIDLETWGPRLRRHPLFGAAGANVNWIQKINGGESWLIRTYERGVEEETLACGTGASASALVLSELGLAESPVSLLTRGGYRLTITIEDSGAGPRLHLSGPVGVAFRGDVEIDG